MGLLLGVLGKTCFSEYFSFSGARFEFCPHLQRIEESAFSLNRVQSIWVPSSDEILCKPFLCKVMELNE
jgi:hypothetical protein